MRYTPQEPLLLAPSTVRSIAETLRKIGQELPEVVEDLSFLTVGASMETKLRGTPRQVTRHASGWLVVVQSEVGWIITGVRDGRIEEVDAGLMTVIAKLESAPKVGEGMMRHVRRLSGEPE